MYKLILLAALLLSSSSYAFAGHESYGGGLCSYADITCVSAADDSSEGAISLCLFDSDKQVATAYVTVEHDGAAPEHSYKAKRMPNDPHRLGSPLRFQGRGFSLSIGATTAPTPIGQYSTLAIRELGLTDVVVYCKFR